MSDQSKQEAEADVEEADVRNGEPAATDEDDHTGASQAAVNRENESPAGE